jgi:hypothetical protein
MISTSSTSPYLLLRSSKKIKRASGDNPETLLFLWSGRRDSNSLPLAPHAIHDNKSCLATP